MEPNLQEHLKMLKTTIVATLKDLDIQTSQQKEFPIDKPNKIMLVNNLIKDS